MLAGENAADVSKLIGAGNTNAAATPHILPEIAANPGTFPPAADLQRLEMLRDFDPKLRRDAVADVNRDQDALKKSALARRRFGRAGGDFRVLAKMPDKSFNPLDARLFAPVWSSTFRPY